MTAPDLTKLTADELLASATDMSLLPDTYPRELMQIRGVDLDELHRRAQANDRLRAAAEKALAFWCPTHSDSDSHVCGAIYIPPRACDCGAAAEFQAKDTLQAALTAAPAAQPTPAAPVTDAEQSAYRSLRTMVATIANDLTERAEAPIPSLRAVGDMLMNCLDATASKEAEKPAVTDAEIEAAIKSLEAHVASYQWSTTLGGLLEVNKRRSELVALIARRVASAGAAPVDSEREAAIDQAIRHHWNCARSHARGDTSPQCVEDCLKADERLRALMRSAPPAPGDQDAKLRELRADLVERADSVRILYPHAKPDEPLRVAIDMFDHITAKIDRLLAAPAASAIAAAPEDKAKWVPCPATRDGWICVRHDGHKGAHESIKRTRWPNEDCTVCKGTGQVEGTAGVMIGGKATMSTRLCPECSTSAMDRLKAKLAAAPEAPAWLEKLRVATNRMVDAAGYAASSLLSDVDIDLKDVRDFAFALREQVESHARRIEALERANNKEEVK